MPFILGPFHMSQVLIPLVLEYPGQDSEIFPSPFTQISFPCGLGM